MVYIFAVIFFVIFLYYNITILKGGLLEKRLYFNEKGEVYYEMSPLMLYTIFIIVTGPMFLVQPLALVKYGVYFASLVGLLFFKKWSIPKSGALIMYYIFFIWMCITMFWSPSDRYGYMLLLKFIIPILSLYMGYNAYKEEWDFWYLCKYVAIWAVVYTFLFGGLAAKFYTWWYFSPPMKNFISYAGFADYLTSIFAIPCILVWWSGNRKWYWIAFAMVLSTVLEVVRTGLGGMFLAVCSFYLMKDRVKSVPILATVVGIALSIVLFVPEVNQKFFGDKAGTVTAEAIFKEDAMSHDKIAMSGRDTMWKLVEDNCYVGHELYGSGLGSVGQYLHSMHQILDLPEILHNDYLQIKCDTGIVGLSLFIAFGVILGLSLGIEVWNSNDDIVRALGALALASFAGIAFAMHYDNVVAHSMSSMIMPFIFYGMYLKAKDIHNESIYQ